ncbi:MAG: LptF/LptG family permease [Bacteroidetes bacterium]|nr:LptF/LptG family permease [Bacteroidota bacterium]
MKKLHILLLRAFVPPFLASFSIVLFILTLQFISTYQNDIFGKVFSPGVIAQLFFYAMANLIKISLPISLLVAGLMTLGKLGEQYELAAIKSSGVSLFRVMYPLLMFGALITGISFYLSWFVIPATNLKLYSLLYDVKQAKPEFALKAGIINSNIPRYRIWFRDRDEAGMMHDFHLWDHSDQATANSQHLVADSAYVVMDDRLLYLRLTLFGAIQYQEKPALNQQAGYVAPFTRMYFDSLKYSLDMTGVGLQRNDESLFSRHQYTQNVLEITGSIDSLKTLPRKPAEAVRRLLNQQIRIDTALAQIAGLKPAPTQLYTRSALELIPASQQPACLARAQHTARQMKQWCAEQQRNLKEHREVLNKFRIEYQMMFAVPLACIIMLFIGAPLGAIIRKGGLGLPSIISILFFIVYYVLLTQGKKLAIDGAVPVWFGVWMPVMIIFPIALYVTYQSATDSRLFDLAAWRQLLPGRGKTNGRKTG